MPATSNMDSLRSTISGMLAGGKLTSKKSPRTKMKMKKAKIRTTGMAMKKPGMKKPENFGTKGQLFV